MGCDTQIAAYRPPFTIRKTKGRIMVLLLRVFLSIGLAILLGHIFFQGLPLIKTLALAGVVFALAYLFEYTKKKDRGG
jgi:hypothetical protein